jgi:hypothetical protein
MAAKKEEEKKLKQVLAAFLKVKPSPKKVKKPAGSKAKAS